MDSTTTFDVHSARLHFPALNQSQVYFDNAGGSQVLGEVIHSINDYLSTTNVQLGATYNTGKQSTRKYEAGIQACADYINASPDEVVLGPSTTQLFRNLSISLMPKLPRDSELIVSAIDHEANIASWVALAETLHLKLIWWRPSPSPNPHQEASTLRPLLTPRTRLVTCTHTSNILGSITDIRAIADLVHTIPGAMLCVDGVAFAPHRPVDVQALGVDFYAFSWYKVFGPHVAQLYARREAQDAAMASLGHFFKKGWTLEEKLGLAGASYELVQSLPEVTRYLRAQGWERMIAHEEQLQECLLRYLRGKPETFTIYGEAVADAQKRVPLVSFIVRGRDSMEIVEKIEKKTNFGFRAGHMYSKRLVDDVLCPGQEGAVRISMVHYNTIEEVEGLVTALDEEVFGGKSIGKL